MVSAYHIGECRSRRPPIFFFFSLKSGDFTRLYLDVTHDGPWFLDKQYLLLICSFKSFYCFCCYCYFRKFFMTYCFWHLFHSLLYVFLQRLLFVGVFFFSIYHLIVHFFSPYCDFKNFLLSPLCSSHIIIFCFYWVLYSVAICVLVMYLKCAFIMKNTHHSSPYFS